jgi:hypothetical protein
MKENGSWAKVRLALNVYIAILLTVLAVLVVRDLGINNSQNHRLAIQAKELSEANRNSGIAACRRGRVALHKINVVAGALTELLRKSVEENERRGLKLTPKQEAFLEREYKLLAPLEVPKNCKSHYPLPAPSGT